MNTMFRRAVLFVLHRDTGHRSQQVGALAWSPLNPGVVRVVGAFDPVRVTIEGATAGLVEQWDEQSGTATVWPHRCSSGRDWWVVDTDDLQVTVRAARVAAFLADVALYACVNGVYAGRVPDREFEWPRRDGGAL